MSTDLTAVLLPKGQLDDEQILGIVLARGYGDVLVRVAPLEAVGLIQVEVHSAHNGLPCEDPELVGQLSRGGRAAFVHVNHSAPQAMVHGFVDGTPGEGWNGGPDDAFATKLAEALGRPLALDAITAADDGSRVGIGIASSRTLAHVRGATLAVPPGTPTELDSFIFHDAGTGLGREGERVAWLAFDPLALQHILSRPSREVAAFFQAAPPEIFGPLAGLRGQVAAWLEAFGEQPLGPMLEQAGREAVRALELCTLAVARVFSCGDALAYWDGRVLPLLSIGDAEPVIDPAEVEELEDAESLLHAVVEVMPYPAPPGGEGAMLASVGDDELGPLAPWVQPGDEYAGALFTVKGGRLLELVRALDGRRLRALMERFERAWYRAARPGQPEGDAFETFRRAIAETGQADVQRFLRDWTELRIVLELAAMNRLAVGVLFYEGA